MIVDERQQQLLAILHRDQFVTVGRLCGLLYASAATIRRDLAELESKGALLRVRGGARLAEGANNDMPTPLRMNWEREKKERIATLAARLAMEATTLFMDSSSTVYYLARQVGDYTGKSVVTNGLATANYLSSQHSAAVYCTGGRLEGQSSFVGQHAIETASAFCADLFFFSCCGFSTDHGTMEAYEDNAAVKRAMSQNAKRRILLCDSTKFGQAFFCRACETASIDLVVTDSMPSEAVRQALKGRLLYP